jgi:hypothetical protein
MITGSERTGFWCIHNDLKSMRAFSLNELSVEKGVSSGIREVGSPDVHARQTVLSQSKRMWNI